MIYSLMVYGITVWGGVLQCTAAAGTLISLQRRIVNSLFGRYHVGSGCKFKAMSLLKINDLHRFYAAIYMFKIMKLSQCPTVKEGLNLRVPEHSYETRHRSLLIPPFPRVIPVRLGYEFQFLTIWNSLPDNLKSLTSLKCFKRALHCNFIESY